MPTSHCPGNATFAACAGLDRKQAGLANAEGAPLTPAPGASHAYPDERPKVCRIAAAAAMPSRRRPRFRFETPSAIHAALGTGAY